MKQCISHLLAQVTPSEVHLDLAGSLSMVLSRIRATRLAGLYIQRFDLRAGSSQLDQLSLLLSRGSERLADLRFPALMLAEHANFDAELIPHCPELRGIWCTPAMDLTRYVPYDEHHLYDMSYFEILLQSHSEMLEAIDIGPILFLHMDQLSDLAFLPSAIVVDLDNFRTEPARSATLEDTYEYKQLQDLELACPGLCRLNFRSFYRVTPPQQLDAMVACISCLKDPNWLQFLMDIELEDFASMIDDAKIEMVVRTCRNVYEELKAVCKERKVDLSGGFVDLMEGRQ